MTVRPLLHTGMHHTARTLFIGLALASAAGAASASGLYDYDKLLDAVDYPTGRAMFSGARWKGAAAAWPGNSALTWTEVTVPATADRSRTIRRFVAAATPLPASVLQFSRLNLDKATPEGAGAWQVYWTRDEITPVNGASTKRMYSTAQRRLVICETGKVVDGGAVRFAALDTSGDAFEVTLDFANPSVWDRALMAQDEGLREEFRVACASALVSAHGEEEGRRRLAQLTEPPAEPSPRQRAMAARQQVLEAVRATVQASAPESGASAAAATGPVGRAKARIRMFQQNGLEGGLERSRLCRPKQHEGSWRRLLESARVHGRRCLQHGHRHAGDGDGAQAVGPQHDRLEGLLRGKRGHRRHAGDGGLRLRQCGDRQVLRHLELQFHPGGRRGLRGAHGRQRQVLRADDQPHPARRLAAARADRARAVLPARKELMPMA